MQRHDPRVARPSPRPARRQQPRRSDSSSRAAATPAAGAQRADQRAGQHVVGGVAQLVGDDDSICGVGQLLEQGVVDHDPPGRAEAGHVGVQRRRTAGRVGDQDVLHRRAVLLGQREQVGAQGPAGIGVKLLKAGSTSTGRGTTRRRRARRPQRRPRPTRSAAPGGPAR